MLTILTKSLNDTILLFISLYTLSLIFILFQKILLYLSKRVFFTALIYIWQTACFIHELCHAVACIIFFHKIIRFAISPQPMVIHTYNKNNPYQSIGCFFISFSPVFLPCLFCIFWTTITGVCHCFLFSRWHLPLRGRIWRYPYLNFSSALLLSFL